MSFLKFKMSPDMKSELDDTSLFKLGFVGSRPRFMPDNLFLMALLLVEMDVNLEEMLFPSFANSTALSFHSHTLETVFFFFS